MLFPRLTVGLLIFKIAELINVVYKFLFREVNRIIMAAKNLTVSQQLFMKIRESSAGQHETFLRSIKKQGNGYILSKKELFKNLPLFSQELLIQLCDENDGLRLALRALNPPVIVPQQIAVEPREKKAEDRAENPVPSGITLRGAEKLGKLPVSKNSADLTQQEIQSPTHSLSSNESTENGVRQVQESDSASLPVPSEPHSEELQKKEALLNNEEKADTALPPHEDTIASTPVNENATDLAPLNEITGKSSVTSQKAGMIQVPARKWKNAAHAVAGKSHLRVYPPVPCQDAAIALAGQYPAVIVCDGAGSSPLSHIGAVKVSEGLSILASSLSPLHAMMLDQKKCSSFSEKDYVTLWIKYAVETIRQLTMQLAHPFSAFRSTLLLAVAGKKRVFWLQIGDGAIIFEEGNTLRPASPPVKGEYANETSFLAEKLNSSEFAFGFEPAEDITGIIAFTDGAGERLISHDGTKVAGKLGLMLEQLRSGKLNGEDIRSFLSDAAVWTGTSGDDKSIAMIACGIS